METREYKVYKFSELTDKQKEKAIENYSDININYEWWDFVEDELSGLGLELVSFELDRGADCTLKAKEDYTTIADNIIKEHGEKTETYIDAMNFLEERDKAVNEAPRDENGDFESEWDLDKKLDKIEAEFHCMLEENYRIILQKNYDYLISDEAIQETFEANDYDFTEDGKID